MASAIAILVTGNRRPTFFHLLLHTAVLNFRRGYHTLGRFHRPLGSVLPAVTRRTGPAGGNVPGRCRCRCRRGCRHRWKCGCKSGCKRVASGRVRDGDGDGDVDGWEARRRSDADGLMPLVRAWSAGEVPLGVVHFRVIICAWVLPLLLQNQKPVSFDDAERRTGRNGLT